MRVNRPSRIRWFMLSDQLTLVVARLFWRLRKRQLKVAWSKLVGLATLFALFALYSGSVAIAATGINTQINFQARLQNAQGAVVPDGNYNIEFKIYQDGTGCVSSGSSPCGGTLKWTEDWLNANTQGVTVKNGYFSVLLGSVNTTLGTAVDFNQDTLWLSINIGNTGSGATFSVAGGDGEMTPFKRFAANPYALNAGKLGGLTSSQFVQLAQGIQADSSTANASLAINKTGGTANILDLQRGGADVAIIANDGSAVFENQTNSTTGFRIQSASAGQTLLTADTSNNIIKIGDATGTDTATTILQVDSATSDPTTGLASRNGGLFYNSTAGQLKVIEGGAVARVCTTTSVCAGYAPASGAAGYVNLQSSTPGTQQTGNVNVSGTIIAGTSVTGPLFQTADGAVASSALTIRTGTTTGGSGLSTGNLSVLTGDGSGTNTSSGNITIDTGAKTSSGVAGTITVGGTNASALTLGRSGLTVTDPGSMLVQGGTLTLGVGSSATGSIVLKNSTNNNNLTLQSGATGGTGLTLTLPNADGNNLDCLKTNGSGVLTFGGCLGGGGGGVTSLNTLQGTLSLVGTTNQISHSEGGTTITLSLPQDINTTSSTIFAGLRSGAAPSSLTTVTDNPLSSSASTVNVGSTTGYPAPTAISPAVLLIDSEVMTYTGVTSTSFTGVVRGVYGTTATTHSSGAVVNNYLLHAVSSGSVAPKFVVQGNGNVGIGSVAPAALLSVGSASPFQVNGSGAVTAVGVNAGSGVLTGTGGLSVTGTITLSSLTTNGPTYMSGGTLNSEAQLAVSRGGTNIGSYTIGDLLYASGATTLSKLADVATGSVLISGGAGIAPSWGTATAANTCSDCIVKAPAVGQNVITPTVSNAIGLTVNGTNGATPNTALSVAQTGNATALNVAGSGTGNIVALSTSNASANGVSLAIQSGSSSQYALNVTTNNGGTPINALYVRGDGNVGIGTTSPSGTLDIRQLANNTETIYGRRFTDSSPTGNLIDLQNAAGTTSIFKVDVSGNTTINGGLLTLSDGQPLQWGAGSVQVYGSSSLNTLKFRTNGSDKVTIDTNGNVGIGTTAPNAKLSVNGNGIFGTGDNTATPGVGTLEGASVLAGTSNTAGATLNIAGGQGTGTGVGGGIILQYAPAGSTGSTVNALQTACSVSGTSGLFSCNSGLTLATGNTFTNSSSTLNTSLAISDKPSGGNIGTAAATVDVATAFSVTQTTAGQTITIPSPTVTTAGRVIYVANTSTNSTSFTLLGSTLNAGSTATLFWNGTAWTFAGADGSSILNQNSSNQSANFRITGTGQANGGFLAPSLDVASSGTLSLGTGANNTAISIGRTGILTTNAGSLTTTQLGTFSGGLTVATGSTFTNASSTLNTAISIANLASGGSIGSAATTVDVATTFTVTQTTAGQTITIPSPTVTTAGRVIYVANTSTNSTSFILLGSTLNPGSTATLLWNGTAWTFAGADGSSILNQNAIFQAATFSVQSNAAASVPTAVIKQAAGQTGDLLQFQPSGSTTPIAKFDFNGNLTVAPTNVAAAQANALAALTVTGSAGGTAGAAQTGGVGSIISLTAGTGGAATAASGIPGAGGTISLVGGTGGAGTSTSVNGNGGNISLQGGAAGTGGSGTAGVIGNVILQSSGGNVGIGTTSPAATLHVVSAAGVNGGTGTNATTALTVVGGAGGNSSTASTAGGTGGAISLTSGAGGNSTGVAGTNGANITLQGGAGGTGTTTGSYGNVILQSSGGNVGIGTSSPTATLHVVGPQPAGGTGAAATDVLDVLGGTGGTGSGGLSSQGGNGGAFNLTGGTGGLPSSSGGPGSGGAGGILTFTGGTGGNASLGTSRTGGSGGTINIVGGAGGVATGGGTNALFGGSGGNVYIYGGAGTTPTGGSSNTPGTAGNVILAETSSNSAQGNVGIGTTNPSAILHVVGVSQLTAGAAATQTLQVTGGAGGTGGASQNGGTGSTVVITTGAGGAGGTSANGGNGGNLTLQTGAGGAAGSGGTAGSYGNIVLQGSGGNVGIGTASPGYNLDVNGTARVATLGTAANIQAVCRNSTTGQLIACDSANTTGITFLQGGNSFTAQAVLGTNDANSLAIRTNGTNRLVVDTSGNLTLQQASTISAATTTVANAAGFNLTVQAGNANGSTTGNVGGTLAFQGGNAAGTGNNNGGNVTVQGGTATGTGTTGNVILAGSGGSVGIGTSSPLSVFHVKGVNPVIRFEDSSAQTVDLVLTQNNNYYSEIKNGNATGLTFSTQGAEAMRISPFNGYVGIATTAPLNVLSVSPLQYNTGTISQSASATVVGVGTTFTAAMVGSTIVYGDDNTVDTITAFTDATHVTVTTSRTHVAAVYSIRYTGLQVASTGNVGIGTGSPVATLDSRGTAQFRSMTDSTTGFMVQNSLGASSLTVDTTNTASSLNVAINGGGETGGTPPTGWAAHGSATVTQDTTSGEFASGSAGIKAATTGATQGARNNVGTAMSASTSYVVSFSIKAGTAVITNANLSVVFSPDGTTSNNATCSSYTASYNPAISTTSFIKYTCTLTTTATATTSSAYLAIFQLDATTRSLFIDNLSIVAQNSTGTQDSGVLRVGGPNSQGLTLLTLDTSAGTPFSGTNTALVGSMYFDTTAGKIQCYDGSNWGACGAAPNSIITLTPEYVGVTLHGLPSGSDNNIGTLTSDFCANQAGVLVVPASGTICGSGDARNFYKWTTTQPSQQTYGLYVTYKLPTTFKNFLANTITLTGRTDNASNGFVTYEVFKSTGSAISACGTATDVTAGSVNTWTKTALNTDPSGCGFQAGNNIIFKINVKSVSSANVYVENLNFTFTNQ